MDVKHNIKKLWNYLNDAFDSEEIENAIQEFEFKSEKLNSRILENLSEDDAKSLLFDLSYMAVNGLFGGNFYTWNEILFYSLEFDEETIDFLNY